MAGRKKIRERGKVRFSEYFKELKEGDKVALKNGLKAYGVSEKAADIAKEYAFNKTQGARKMQPDEFATIVAAFGKKQEDIFADCPNDKRCIMENGKPALYWGEGKNVKFDFLNLFQYWIAEDQKNPNAFMK